MSESAYEKLASFLRGLEARSDALWAREQTIVKELAALEASLDEAIITGTQRAAQEKIVGLKVELGNVQRERAACDRPPKTGILAELAEALWQETADEITKTYRLRWNDEMAELERARAMYLSAVRALGAIKAEADHISSSVNELMIKCGHRKAVPTLSTSIFIRHDRKQGPIFLGDELIAKTFLGRERL